MPSFGGVKGLHLRDSTLMDSYGKVTRLLHIFQIFLRVFWKRGIKRNALAYASLMCSDGTTFASILHA